MCCLRFYFPGTLQGVYQQKWTTVKMKNLIRKHVLTFKKILHIWVTRMSTMLPKTFAIILLLSYCCRQWCTFGDITVSCQNRDGMEQYQFNKVFGFDSMQEEVCAQWPCWHKKVLQPLSKTVKNAIVKGFKKTQKDTLAITGKEFAIITFQYMNNIHMLLKAGLHPGYHWLKIYSNSLINVAKRANITASMHLISTAFQPNLPFS